MDLTGWKSPKVYFFNIYNVLSYLFKNLDCYCNNRVFVVTINTLIAYKKL